MISSTTILHWALKTLFLLVCASYVSAQSSATATATASCDVWHFDDSSQLGPSQWPTFCPTCNGGSQSPIDIPLNSTVAPQDSHLLASQLKVTLAPVTTYKFYNLTNSGDSLVLKLVPKLVSITGAGLSGTYYADELHWHWGNSSAVGSEHTVHGKRFAMEGHLVSHHSDFNSLDEAIGHADAVAVFAVLYEEQVTTSPSPYTALFSTQNLHKVSVPFAVAPLFAFDINYLLPFNFYPLYRYFGSLTTPACTEGIIWSVFSEPVQISSTQMDTLRTFLRFKAADNSTGFPLANNFRPTQPLNGRTVHLVDPHDAQRTSGSSSVLQSKVPTLFGSLLLTVFFVLAL